MTTTDAYLIAIIPSCILAFVNYHTYSHGPRYAFIGKYYEERLHGFVAPAFFLWEPYLYKKHLPKRKFLELCDDLRQLAEKNRLLVNDRILDHLDIIQRTRNNADFDYRDHFESLCSHIDNDMDFLQSKLGLPRRSYIYRINHQQLHIRNFFRWPVFSEFMHYFVLPFAFYLVVTYAVFHFVTK